MATDLRGLTWTGDPTATAQDGAAALGGYTKGNAYQVKAIAVDNATDTVYVLVTDDHLNVRAVALPTSGGGPFTFQ